jgi:hypothetical protein
MGATEQRGQLGDHGWDRLGIGLKASEAEPTGVGFSVASSLGTFECSSTLSCGECTTETRTHQPTSSAEQ